MYIPQHFREDDLTVLHTLMRDYSFATLVSVQEDGVPIATHLPFIFEPEPAPYGTLAAHFALGNPQWRTFATGREVLVIFQGPHAYISPSWYEAELSVPTWNYATVHAYGCPRIIEDHAEFLQQLQQLIAVNEAQFEKPWQYQLPADYLERMIKGTVGFSMKITRLEGKFKMSQNRPVQDQRQVIEALRSSTNSGICEVAAIMQKRLKTNE